MQAIGPAHQTQAAGATRTERIDLRFFGQGFGCDVSNRFDLVRVR